MKKMVAVIMAVMLVMQGSLAYSVWQRTLFGISSRSGAYIKKMSGSMKDAYRKWSEKKIAADMHDTQKEIQKTVSDVLKSRPEGTAAEIQYAATSKTQMAGGNNTKWNIMGRPTTVVVESIHVHGKKSFSESFFDFLKNGGKNRVLFAGIAGGGVGGYALGRMNSKPDEKIIVVNHKE